MCIEYDPAKRLATLAARDLDMARSAEVWDGPTLTIPDARLDYGEPRFMTAGFLKGRMVIIIWPPRGDARRIISLRKANARETAAYQLSLRP